MGGSGEPPLTPEAIEGVVRWSGGIPRLINSICDSALLMAYGDTCSSVGARYIRDAAMNLALIPSLAAPAMPAQPGVVSVAAEAAPKLGPVEVPLEGLQFHRVIGRDEVPRVCDMSSDFLSYPCEAERFSIIYAHAQKNLGPAGVTVVVMRRELLEQVPDNLHSFLDYRNHARAHSIYNTPPVFPIYVVMLVTRWLKTEIGGLAHMAEINRAKADLLYGAIDASEGFYRGRAELADRSAMNVVFNLRTPELEAAFLGKAQQAGFRGLSGHRSLGGVRASIYNAVTKSAVQTLRDFMADFQAENSR